MFSLEHKIPPPVVGLLVASGMWGLSLLGFQIPIAPLPKYVLVFFIAAAGVALDVMGILAFRRARTTVNPLKPERARTTVNPLKPERASSMVTHGIYRFTRNPMYLGMVMFLLAWAIHLAALLPFIGPLVFVLYITRFQIRPEERALKELFGDEYVAYAARVRRWL